MKKENKSSNLNVRMSASDLQELDFFTSFWYKRGLDMGNSELVRNALKEYMDAYEISRVILEGNLVGVRMNPMSYKFADLFDMVADAQDAMMKETDPSKKYLLGKQFELLQKALTLELSAESIKKAHRIETPEKLTQEIYKREGRIIANVGVRK